MGIVEELRAARFLPPGFAIGEITSYGNLNGEYWFAPRAGSWSTTTTFRRTTGCRSTRWKRCCEPRWRPAEHLEPVRLDATKVEQDAGSARVTITRDGASEVLEGDYLVGCDGGHSIVREQMGIPRSGHDFDQLMVLIVLRSRELHDELGKRFPPKSIYRAMHPELNGYWKFFGRIDVGEGFFFHAPVRRTRRGTISTPVLLEEATGFPFKAEFDHVGFWDLRVAVAEKYQAGACSSPATPRTAIRHMAASASTTGWRTRSISAGSSRRSSTAGRRHAAAIL